MQTSAKTQPPRHGVRLIVTAARAVGPAAGGQSTHRLIELARHWLLETRSSHGLEQRLLASAENAVRWLRGSLRNQRWFANVDNRAGRAWAAYAATVNAAISGASFCATGEEA